MKNTMIGIINTKPCPFCGGTDIEPRCFEGEKAVVVFMRCMNKNCDAEGKKTWFEKNDGYTKRAMETFNDAIIFGNKEEPLTDIEKRGMDMFYSALSGWQDRHFEEEGSVDL